MARPRARYDAIGCQMHACVAQSAYLQISCEAGAEMIMDIE